MPRRRKNDSSWGWLIGLGVGLIGYQLLKNKEVDAYPTKDPIPERKRNEKLHTQDGPSEPDLKPRKIGKTSFPLTKRFDKEITITRVVEKFILRYAS